MPKLTAQDAANARRQFRKRRLQAFLFVVPLLIFILFAFVAPITTMLFRSVYNPTVAELVPETLEMLEDWEGETLPDAAVITQMAIDMKRMANNRTSGRFADEINRALPGMSSVIKSTARGLRRADDAELAANGAEMLLEENDRWSRPATWRAIRSAGQGNTSSYYLTAVDMEYDAEGEVVMRDTQIYKQLYTKTLRMAMVITGLTMILGYPLAFYMSQASPARANFLMVFVLLPFWTSLLVRTSAWKVMLQQQGVINDVLVWIGLVADDTRLVMINNQAGTIIAMTHILLPFMILPMYSVMQTIQPTYLRAAKSMGATNWTAFWRVSFPQAVPGIGAGSILVFILAIGYYITPEIVGGTTGTFISNRIAYHISSALNWGLAAALGTILLAAVLILYWAYDKIVGIDNVKLG